MKIYTRTGDRGETGLFGGQRVKKTHPRVIAYGTVDELNAVLGQAVACCGASDDGEDLASDGSAAAGSRAGRLSRSARHELAARLRAIQSRLFDVGADLASPPDTRAGAWLPTRVQPAWAEALEAGIDGFEQDLPPLTSFIVPGGTPLAAVLHVARTVCRRAEREVVAAMEADSTIGADLVIYLNRLSDWLFVAARWANHQAGVADAPWHPGEVAP